MDGKNDGGKAQFPYNWEQLQHRVARISFEV